jgi:hypothetical protein
LQTVQVLGILALDYLTVVHRICARFPDVLLSTRHRPIKGFPLERGFKLAVDDRGVRPTTFPNNQGIAGSRICCDVFTEKSRKLLQLWQR